MTSDHHLLSHKYLVIGVIHPQNIIRTDAGARLPVNGSLKSLWGEVNSLYIKKEGKTSLNLVSVAIPL